MERKFTEQEEIRRKKLGELINSGADPYQVLRFDRNYNSATFKQAFEKYTKDELHSNTSKVTIAGRIMAIRQTFVVIKDFFGRVQLYIDRKSVESKYLEIFNNSLDIGDIVGIEGTPMKTNTGEVTVRVKTITLLSKALKPLPEKFHGLVDEEGRGRHRYVDLIMNDESMNTFILRSKIVTTLRKFMEQEGFIEMETPVLQPIMGGAAARPFITKHNVLDRNFYLRVATELHLKRLIVGGFEKVFEIGRIFRNEGMDTTHNPEFTTMEAY
jgi:lysyl-tRNA synthetase class 2